MQIICERNIQTLTWLKVSATDRPHTKSWDISLDGHNLRLGLE